MKFEIKEEKEVFEPIELKITIESEEELAYIWTLHSLGYTQVQDIYAEANKKWIKDIIPKIDNYEMWNNINNICKARGLKL